MILSKLKIYLSCDYRHKVMKSVLNCIYCFLNNSLHVPLVSFPKLKMKALLKYILLTVNSCYRLVSILSTYDYYSIRGLFFHSMALEIYAIGKVISY